MENFSSSDGSPKRGSPQGDPDAPTCDVGCHLWLTIILSCVAHSSTHMYIYTHYILYIYTYYIIYCICICHFRPMSFFGFHWILWYPIFKTSFVFIPFWGNFSGGHFAWLRLSSRGQRAWSLPHSRMGHIPRWRNHRVYAVSDQYLKNWAQEKYGLSIYNPI